MVATVHFQVPSLVLMKLEHDQGVKIERRERDGKNIVELEHIKDLILSNRTRLHKQAFVQPFAGSYSLEVTDTQRGYRSTVAVAQFFLTKFLGARTVVDARDATKRFAAAVQTLVESLPDPKRQTEIRLDLASELNSRSQNVVPGQFANTYLAAEEIPRFDQALQQHEVPANFGKDLGL